MLQYNTRPGNKAVVIYHANCMDGFAAAWAFKRLAEWRYGKNVSYHACNYGNGLPEIELTDTWPDVFIVDFSFSRAELSQLALTSNTVTVLDHHKTAAEALVGWEDQPANVDIVFDMNRSGAGITWDFLKEWNLKENHPIDFRNSRAGLISYVEDRDLWRFKLQDSRAVNAYIALADHTFDAYDELYGEIMNEFDKVVEIGEALEKKHRKIAEQIAEHAWPCTLTDGKQKYKGLEVNCPPQFASDVGNILAARCQTYAHCWWIDEQQNCNSSLRGIGKVDVSAIAKFMGGGGHANAAGFKIPKTEFTL